MNHYEFRQAIRELVESTTLNETQLLYAVEKAVDEVIAEYLISRLERALRDYRNSVTTAREALNEIELAGTVIASINEGVK